MASRRLFERGFGIGDVSMVRKGEYLSDGRPGSRWWKPTRDSLESSSKALAQLIP